MSRLITQLSHLQLPTQLSLSRPNNSRSLPCSPSRSASICSRSCFSLSLCCCSCCSSLSRCCSIWVVAVSRSSFCSSCCSQKRNSWMNTSDSCQFCCRYCCSSSELISTVSALFSLLLRSIRRISFFCRLLRGFAGLGFSQVSPFSSLFSCSPILEMFPIFRATALNSGWQSSRTGYLPSRDFLKDLSCLRLSSDRLRKQVPPKALVESSLSRSEHSCSQPSSASPGHSCSCWWTVSKKSCCSCILQLYFILLTAKVMNNRELELQSIIKSLENKILILKEENKIISERSDSRLKQQAEEFGRLTAEKDRLIEYLKVELMKDREAILQEHSFYESSRSREKDDAVKELEKYRGKCSELEKKIQKVTENYELRQKELEEELQKLQEKQFEEVTARSEVVAEIDKLNKFYTSSRIEIPKRKETLEWTDKLLNFLTRSEAESDKSAKELYSFIKNSLETLKSEILQSLKAAAESEDNSLKERRQIVTSIKEIVEEQNRTKNEIAEDNEKFWEAIKKEKAGSYTDRLHDQEKEFAEEKKKLADQNQELIIKVKALEAERKTLLLGFTELKSLYESREKTYREEIGALKQTIENLLSNSEEREVEFEKQTKMLHSQLNSLNERYYENIEVPLFKMSSKLDQEIKTARQELAKLNENKNFVKLVEKLDSVMQTYIFESSGNSRLSGLIAEHIKKSTEVVEWAKVFAEEQAERLSEIEPIYASNYQENEHQVNVMECSLKQLEWKERENKFIYEITTLKKHNKKLKEYCDNLESQLYGDGRSKSAIKRPTPTKSSQTKQQPQKEAETSQRIIDLEGEIQRLTSINKGYESEFFYQLTSMKQHLQRLTGREVKDKMQVIEMHKAMNEISNFNESLADFLEKENEHIDGIRQVLANLNNVLVKPVQLFDRFVNKISNCCKTPELSGVSVNALQTSNLSSKTFDKLRSTYQQISVKRTQNTQQTNKLVSELIKMLRDTAPLVSRPLNKLQSGAQNIEKDKLDKSRIKEGSNIQKKIKELQTCRIKSREEVIRKLERIEQILKNLQSKGHKKVFMGSNRIEELLQKKIEECIQKAQGKKKNDPNELTQITAAAMKELKLKLKASITENEGLIKQMECLQLSKKRES